MMKPKDSFDNLYQRIADRGITFNNHSKEDVIDILSYRNYYYRLISYRKNFEIDTNINKYIGLDFQALCDMASIDTYLREYLFSLCLDVEHAAKTSLMTHLTNNKSEDGYSILNEFKDFDKGGFNRTKNNFKRSKYKQEMFRKRKDSLSVWVFLEAIDFGTLIKFLEFYTDKYSRFIQNINYDDLKFIKNIRNACAHNDIYFINFFVEEDEIIPRDRSKSTSKKLSVSLSDLKNPKIHDLVILFHNHKVLCSTNLNTRRYDEGTDVLNRMKKNEYLYNESDDYHRVNKIIDKCIDYLKEK